MEEKPQLNDKKTQRWDLALSSMNIENKTCTEYILVSGALPNPHE